jgi:hypothetical protein
VSVRQSPGAPWSQESARSGDGVAQRVASHAVAALPHLACCDAQGENV